MTFAIRAANKTNTTSPNIYKAVFPGVSKLHLQKTALEMYGASASKHVLDGALPQAGLGAPWSFHPWPGHTA